MNIEQIKTLTDDDMQAVDAVIRERLASDVVLVNQLSHYIVNSGGKRLRPLLSIIASRAYDYQGQHHFTLAAIIEFIHTATLLHDDVVDESNMRRGRETANALFGNAASVLVGDFLYSRAFEMMVEVKSMKVMQILAETTNIIAEGEVLQLMNCHDADTTEQRYLDVIHAKTAKLFEAATRLGAVITNRPQEEEQAMADYGMHLGTAFQLIDDVLDYSSSSEQMGKNVGDDLAEGKPTLPLIYAMRNGTKEQAAIVRKAIEEGGLDYIDQVMEAIGATGAIAYAEETAKKEAKLAIEQLAHLPDSPYKEALIGLAKFSVDRSF
ncbi:MAG: octaprenyl diphosphate synthase [Gammaproteobacteria bacterium]